MKYKIVYSTGSIFNFRAIAYRASILPTFLQPSVAIAFGDTSAEAKKKLLYILKHLSKKNEIIEI